MPALLSQLVLAYGVGVVVVLGLLRLRVPSVVGFLVAGVVLGPHGFALVRDPAAVNALADIGVVILLFTVGVELNLGRAMRGGGRLLVVGLLQFVLTALVAGGIAWGVAGRAGSASWAFVVGVMVAGTSTTLLLRVLGDRGEGDSPQARVGIGVCIVQDLLIVPIMVVLPMLAGRQASAGEAWLALGKAIAVILGTVALARLVVPRLFEWVVNARSRELFALTVIFLCLATAWAATLADVSVALGAFLGGLVVSESAYSQQVLGELRPIRDGLAGLFFIGIGMLLDAGWVAAHPIPVLVVVVAVVVVKALVAGASVVVGGFGARTAVLVALALAQVGEFSFLVAKEAGGLGLLSEDTLQLLLAACVLTMVAAPFVYRPADRLSGAFDRWTGGRLRGTVAPGAPPGEGLDQHVILVGYGLTGRNIARALNDHGIPFVAVEMNPGTVRQERRLGVPIFYGDAGHAAVLERAGLARARLVVVAIGDAPGTRRVVETAKDLRPEARVVVRTRYLSEAEVLREMGADEVVPDEVETSVEVFARVLRAYDVPSDAIERSVRAVRAEQADAVRSAGAREGLTGDRARMLAHADLEFQVVGPGAPADGRTIGELAVRKRTGATIVAVRRGGEVLPDPGADTRLQAADVVVTLGTPASLAGAAPLFRAPAPQAPAKPPSAEEEVSS